MLKKEEWEKLLGNFSFLNQEYLEKSRIKQENDKYAEYGDKTKEIPQKIKDFFELIFNLSKAYKLFYEIKEKNQSFEKKSQVDTFLNRLQRYYGLNEPSNYNYESNYESLMCHDAELLDVDFEKIKGKEDIKVVRDFAQLLNTGFSILIN